MRMDRDDLIEGLRDLAQRVTAHGFTGVSLRIVGGAALRLGYFDRDTTVDIDASIEPVDLLRPIIDEIAHARGWPVDWLNDKANIFIPTWGRSVDWHVLLDNENITIEIAPIDALLAMKLQAARPGRDTDDIAKLMQLNKVLTLSAAEELYEEFYPGDGLRDRTIVLVERILQRGLPREQDPPAKPELG